MISYSGFGFVIELNTGSYQQHMLILTYKYLHSVQ